MRGRPCSLHGFSSCLVCRGSPLQVTPLTPRSLAGSDNSSSLASARRGAPPLPSSLLRTSPPVFLVCTDVLAYSDTQAQAQAVSAIIGMSNQLFRWPSLFSHMVKSKSLFNLIRNILSLINLNPVIKLVSKCNQNNLISHEAS